MLDTLIVELDPSHTARLDVFALPNNQLAVKCILCDMIVQIRSGKNAKPDAAQARGKIQFLRHYTRCFRAQAASLPPVVCIFFLPYSYGVDDFIGSQHILAASLEGTSFVRLWHYTVHTSATTAHLMMGPDVPTGALDDFWGSPPLLRQLNGRNPSNLAAFAVGELLYPEAIPFPRTQLKTFVNTAFRDVMRSCQQPAILCRVDHVLVVNFLGQLREGRSHIPQPLVVQGPAKRVFRVPNVDRVRNTIMQKNGGLLDIKTIKAKAQEASELLSSPECRHDLFDSNLVATLDEVKQCIQW